MGHPAVSFARLRTEASLRHTPPMNPLACFPAGFQRLSTALRLMVLFLSLSLSSFAQLQWSVFDETSSKTVVTAADGTVAITVPAGQHATLYATNFVPVDYTSVTTGDLYVTASFKSSGGLSGISGGTRSIGFGLFNSNNTNTGTTFADDNGYFTWLNGRSTGSLIELRRLNGDGTASSLLNPATTTAWNSLGTGTTVQTSGALTDSGVYNLQLHLVRSAKGIAFGTTSSNTTGAGVWVSGESLSQTAYTNPDTNPATTLFGR